jgi:aldehyde:ferredoxin oxidoreductase
VAKTLVLKPKKRCCKDNPRCKRCPVVCKRLVKQGRAVRRDDGIVVLRPDLTKKQYKAARAR